MCSISFVAVFLDLFKWNSCFSYPNVCGSFLFFIFSFSLIFSCQDRTQKKKPVYLKTIYFNFQTNARVYVSITMAFCVVFWACCMTISITAFGTIGRRQGSVTLSCMSLSFTPISKDSTLYWKSQFKNEKLKITNQWFYLFAVKEYSFIFYKVNYLFVLLVELGCCFLMSLCNHISESFLHVYLNSYKFLNFLLFHIKENQPLLQIYEVILSSKSLCSILPPFVSVLQLPFLKKS